LQLKGGTSPEGRGGKDHRERKRSKIRRGAENLAVPNIHGHRNISLMGKKNLRREGRFE